MNKLIMVEMYINGEHIGNLTASNTKTAVLLREATALYSSYLESGTKLLPLQQHLKEYTTTILGHYPKKHCAGGTAIRGTSITWPNLINKEE